MTTFPDRRMRRLRRTPAMRRLVAETRLSVDDLVAPLFVREGIDEPQPIASLPGVVQHTRESLRKEAALVLLFLSTPLVSAPAAETPLPEALAAFDSALRLRPNDPMTWQNIGITYLNFGRSVRAREALEKALAENDRLPRAWNARGVLLEQEGKSDEAIASWRHAVELEPGLLDAWMNIAVVAGKRKDVARQRDALSQFIARAPEGQYASEVAQARRLLAGLPLEK